MSASWTALRCECELDCSACASGRTTLICSAKENLADGFTTKNMFEGLAISGDSDFSFFQSSLTEKRTYFTEPRRRSHPSSSPLSSEEDESTCTSSGECLSSTPALLKMRRP